jgi:hypothetical protein
MRVLLAKRLVGAVGEGRRLGASRAVHQEGDALHLLHGVEAHEAHEARRVRLGAQVHLLEGVVGGVAAEHGQLPHGPVAVVVVGAVDGRVQVGHVAVVHAVPLRRLGELDARGVPHVHAVVHLLGDLRARQRRQERERLEELVADRVPHLHGGALGGASSRRGHAHAAGGGGEHSSTFFSI